MAIIIVVILSGILMISAIALHQSSRGHRHFAEITKRDLQAYFMAVSAIQHAELKIRYFPTELYDAAALSLGKNPYFDFTALTPTEYGNLSDLRRQQYRPFPPHIHFSGPFNKGPRFISAGTLHPATHLDHWFRLSALDTADTDPSNFSGRAEDWFGGSGWPLNTQREKILNSDLYLWRFRRDISNLNTVQPALGWAAAQIQPEVTLDIATTDGGFPFQGVYGISDMQVMSIVGNRRLNEEAITITAVGSIVNPANGETVTHQIDRIVRVKRN